MKKLIKKLLRKNQIGLLAKVVAAARTYKEGDKVEVEFGEEFLKGVIKTIQQKKAKIELEDGTMTIVSLKDIKLGKPVKAPAKLAGQIKEWDKLKTKFDRDYAKVKVLGKEVAAFKKEILPALADIDNQMVRVDKAVVGIKETITSGKPYKAVYEALLAKVSKKLAQESITLLEKLKNEGGSVKKELVKLEGKAVAFQLPKWIKTFFSKIKSKAKSIFTKSEPDVKKLEEAVKN